MKPTPLVEFGRIDQTANADYFICFLDEVCAQESAQAYKRRLIELLDLRPGLHVLDVGCGTGDDARAMATIVAPGGNVVGVDNSQAMIAEAQKRAAGMNLPIEFHAADVQQLPFASGTFDCVQADRSPMHIPDVRQALAEMLRVTKPGGRVAIYEVDFETLTIDADDRVLARKIANAWCDSFRNGWLGRHMPALFAEVGLREMTVMPHTLILSPAMLLPLLGATTVERAVAKGIVTPTEASAWLVHLDDLQRTGRFFSTLTGFLVAGRK